MWTWFKKQLNIEIIHHTFEEDVRACMDMYATCHGLDRREREWTRWYAEDILDGKIGRMGRVERRAV